MNLHEYQSKKIFAELRHSGADRQGRRHPRRGGRRGASGSAARSGWSRPRCTPAAAARPAASRSRKDLDGVREAAAGMLGQRLVTKQTGAEGLPISQVYVETGSAIAREIYLEPDAEPREGPHRHGRLGRRRHGHRGSRRARAGEDPHRRPSIRPWASRPTRRANWPSASASRARRSREFTKILQGAVQALHRERREPGRGESADRHRATARWWRSTPRSASTPTRCSGIRSWSRCATARRKIRSRHAPPSTTSTTSRSTATSPAW